MSSSKRGSLIAYVYSSYGKQRPTVPLQQKGGSDSGIVSGSGKSQGNSGQSVVSGKSSGDGIVSASGKGNGNAYGLDRSGIATGSGSSAGSNGGIVSAGGSNGNGAANGNGRNK